MFSHNVLFMMYEYKWLIIFNTLRFFVCGEVDELHPGFITSIEYQLQKMQSSETHSPLYGIETRHANCDNSLSGTLVPEGWPCQWNTGFIPYVLDFYCSSPRRLMALVRSGHEYLESRSCFKFVELDPVDAAQRPNFTYLYYTFTGVQESCCNRIWEKPVGRRMLLISPVCTQPAQVAHATLHAFGIEHNSKDVFVEEEVGKLLFMPYEIGNNCYGMARKYAKFQKKIDIAPLYK